MLAIHALRIYYDHWGREEIKERRRRQAVHLLQKKFSKLGMVSPPEIISLFSGDWVDLKEAVSFWKEIYQCLLHDPPYTRRSATCRISRSLRLPSPKPIYKLGIKHDLLRQVDAIVAL